MQTTVLECSKPDVLKRVQWVDVLKIIGMFEIFLFHNLNADSVPRSFFFVFFVEMYFVMSGFFSDIKKNESFLTFVWKKFKNIMIPYFSFALLCEVVLVFNNNYSFHQLLADGKSYLFGIRTTLPAQTLWFLPCLFLVAVIYRALLTVLRSKYVVFLAAFLISWFFPYSQPSWFWNLDSAFRYLVFYALGHLVYPWIVKYRFANLKIRGKFIYTALILFALSFSVLAYFYSIYFPFTLANISLPVIVINLYKTFAAIVIIFLHIQLALVFEKSQTLSKLGRNTLIFCGTETVSTTLVISLLSVFGITVGLAAPLSTTLFAVICMCVSYFVFVPLFNHYLPWTLGKWKKEER